MLSLKFPGDASSSAAPTLECFRMLLFGVLTLLAQLQKQPGAGLMFIRIFYGHYIQSAGVKMLSFWVLCRETVIGIVLSVRYTYRRLLYPFVCDISCVLFYRSHFDPTSPQG